MKPSKLHHRTPDLVGSRFGSLTVQRSAHSDGKKRFWHFRCDCGKSCVKAGADVTKEVKRGGTPNCGCLTKRLMSTNRKTHGMSKHPAYWVWRSMSDRCHLPTHQAYRNYGARGIRVCHRWRKFEAFWEDMGSTYRTGLTLDRINNNGDYNAKNCRWTTRREQGNNKRNNVYVRSRVGSLTVSQAAEFWGINESTLRYRIAKGWPHDKLMIPPSPKNREKVEPELTAIADGGGMPKLLLGGE